MNRNEFGLVKNLTFSAACDPYRIVAFDAAAETVKQAAAAADKICGVTGVVGVIAANERGDVQLGDIGTVEFGAAITAGDPITADAEGKGIVAVPPADTTIRIIGFAMEAGGVGVLGQVHITPQTMRG